MNDWRNYYWIIYWTWSYLAAESANSFTKYTKLFINFLKICQLDFYFFSFIIVISEKADKHRETLPHRCHRIAYRLIAGVRD